MLRSDEIADKIARILIAATSGGDRGAAFSAASRDLAGHAPFETYSIAGLPQPGRGIGTGTVLASTWPEGLLHDYLKFQLVSRPTRWWR